MPLPTPRRLYAPKGFLFPFALLIDAAIAYVGVSQQGVATQFKTPPGTMAMKVTITAGNYGGGNINVTLQTSNDNQGWVDTAATLNFTADATKELDVAVPIMRFVRFAYTTGGSGTIKSILMTDVNPNAVAPNVSEQRGNPVGGFRVCMGTVVFDELLSVPNGGGALAGASEVLQGDNVTAAFVSVQVTGRTAGDVTPKVQYKPTGGSVFEDSGDAFNAISGNITSTIMIQKRLGTEMRILYTPANGFDGKVTTKLSHDGIWDA